MVIAGAFTATPLLYQVFSLAHERWDWPTLTSTIVLLGFAFLLILLLNQTVSISRSWRERAMARSLAFRLLGPSWEQIPGFRLIAVNFAHAGAWEVLPRTSRKSV